MPCSARSRRGGGVTLADIWKGSEGEKRTFWDKHASETLFRYRLMYPEKSPEEIERQALEDICILPPGEQEKAERDILRMIDRLKKLA